mgnify:CR=1 FL=1
MKMFCIDSLILPLNSLEQISSVSWPCISQFSLLHTSESQWQQTFFFLPKPWNLHSVLVYVNNHGFYQAQDQTGPFESMFHV